MKLKSSINVCAHAHHALMGTQVRMKATTMIGFWLLFVRSGYFDSRSWILLDVIFLTNTLLLHGFRSQACVREHPLFEITTVNSETVNNNTKTQTDNVRHICSYVQSDHIPYLDNVNFFDRLVSDLLLSCLKYVFWTVEL